MSQVNRALCVGPVLMASADTDSIVEAIREENEQVDVEERGSYVRVLVPKRCRVSKEAIERYCGHEFRLPGDLERIMSSFKGRILFTPDAVEWYYEGTGED